MQKLQTKEMGFGLVGIAIIVAAVLLAGVIGARAFMAVTSKKDTAQSTNQNKQVSNTTPVDTATYLDIKELGVKVKLSDDIKDATYYYQVSNGLPTALISTKSLVDKAGSVCDAKSSWPLGTIERSQSLTLPWGVTLSVNNTNVFQLEDGYYIYTTPNQPCSQYATNSNLEIAQLASFKEALKTIQLDK